MKIACAALIAAIGILSTSCQTDPLRPFTRQASGKPAAVPSSKGSEHHAEQIVFSGTGSSSLGPFGFWIWSEDEEASNPYHGEASGSIYLYDLHLTKHVEGEVEETAEGQYAISVSARDGSIVATFTNTPPVTRGPTNSVVATFTAPSAGTGTSFNAVVTVTGP
jgi:hypothetical protein